MQRLAKTAIHFEIDDMQIAEDTQLGWAFMHAMA